MGRRGRLRIRILDALAWGPASHGAVCDRLGLDYYSVLPWPRLLLAGEVIVIGTFAQALACGHPEYCGSDHQRKFRRRDAKIYALPGTLKLPILVPATPRPKRGSGSGVIAAPRTIGGPLAGWGIWR